MTIERPAFTLGVEEEFQIVDPAILDLEHRYEDLSAACLRDEVLAEAEELYVQT